MKKITGLLFAFMLLHCTVMAQSFAINTTGAAAHASAILDVSSISKGLLIPRLTSAQRTGIALPGKGLLVYDSTLKSFYFHDGVNWQQLFADSNNLWRRNGTHMYNANTGNVGIGTSAAQSLLQVKGGAVLFDSTIGSTPVSGAGTRMMWIPAKAAFRAGTVSTTYWDDANIGLASFATGTDSKASGNYSTAMGIGAFASGNYSTAIGYSITAPGNSALAMGCWGASASGAYAVAIGMGPTASGLGSVAMGSFSNANADFSLAWGTASVSSGVYSVAMGNYVVSKSYGGFTTGMYNDTANAADPIIINPLNRIFQIGNGTAGNALSNAMTVLQNGKTGIGTTTPVALLHVKKGAVLFDSTIGSTPVSGAGTRMMWIPAKGAFRAGAVSSTHWNDVNIGFYSTAIGFNTTASGINSVAMGEQSIASETSSTAMGYGTIASGSVSTAMGSITTASGSYATSMGYSTTAGEFASTAMGSYTTASGFYSTAMGNNTTASGNISTAAGYFTKSKSFGGFAAGIFNDTTNAASPTGINALNRIFQIGNGLSEIARGNAMTVLQNGNIGIGEVNPTVPLNFTSTLGDKISLWGNGINHYGFGIQPSLLQVYTLDAGNDIVFGYGNSAALTENVRFKGNGRVGIGTNNPAVLLDVNGTTTTNALQVSDGNIFTKMQSGSVVVGTNGTGQKTITITFPVAFTSVVPRVFATARNEPGSSYNDAFSVSIRSITATNVTVNVQRTDSNAGWAQILLLDWFAVE